MSELYEQSYIEHLGKLVTESVPQWELPNTSTVTLLTVSENATFQVTDDNDQRLCVVRVHRPDYHTLDEIESELLWIEALRAENVVTTPRPIPTLDDDFIVTLQDGDETRHMVAFEFMPGAEPSADQSLVTRFHQLGAITARLHGHARRWKAPDNFTRKTWNFETTIGENPHWGHWQNAPGLGASDRDVLTNTVALIESQLQTYGASDMKFGLVHADLRLANLLMDGEQLAVIDFDDCGLGWYVYDFAAAISFMEEDPQVPDLLQAWLSGYRQVTPLSEEDEALIPIFIMLRRLMLTAWLATHSETPTAQELGDGFLEGTLRMARCILHSGAPLDLQPSSQPDRVS
ncbi:phosphotransferase enzyme family protein [Granulosicoccus sp. 3-233]|uniref:phosphotransferase enzyme family protein n=1 Tax=Granulosicoccus sp. 3-233 TaxID=3417969 RepID=UPI003D33AAD7